MTNFTLLLVLPFFSPPPQVYLMPSCCGKSPDLSFFSSPSPNFLEMQYPFPQPPFTAAGRAASSAQISPCRLSRKIQDCCALQTTWHFGYRLWQLNQLHVPLPTVLILDMQVENWRSNKNQLLFQRAGLAWCT